MKKFGFTLTELLITLGIVGVVSALVGPALVNIMPDKNKAMFLKNYKELSVINQKLLDDNTIYYSNFTLSSDGFRKIASCYGLECESTPLRSPYTNYSGNTKYPYLLANHLGIDSPNSTSFTTSDQTVWNVTRNSSGNYTIVLKVDGIGSDCIYSSSCLKPKKFQLNVDRYGHITPGDALSEAYLLNKTKLNNKKADLEKAAEIFAESSTEE